MTTSQNGDSRGGATVGFLGDLDPICIAAVVYLRLWFAGPEERAQLRSDFTLALGGERGERLCEQFGLLCALCAEHARRPLMRHGVTCKCIGADEACFAHIVGAALAGEREDAILMAALIVRPDVAMGLADLALAVSLDLMQMVHRPVPSDSAPNWPDTLERPAFLN